MGSRRLSRRDGGDGGIGNRARNEKSLPGGVGRPPRDTSRRTSRRQPCSTQQMRAKGRPDCSSTPSRETTPLWLRSHSRAYTAPSRVPGAQDCRPTTRRSCTTSTAKIGTSARWGKRQWMPGSIPSWTPLSSGTPPPARRSSISKLARGGSSWSPHTQSGVRMPSASGRVH